MNKKSILLMAAVAYFTLTVGIVWSIAGMTDIIEFNWTNVGYMLVLVFCVRVLFGNNYEQSQQVVHGAITRSRTWRL